MSDSPRLRRMWTSGHLARVLAAAIVALVVANLTALSLADRESGAGTETAIATVPDQRADRPTEEREPLDPLAGITVVRAERPVALPRSGSLPVPEPVPADPHAPTPEIRHGQLTIPAIGLSQPWFEGVTLTAINRGPSHWPGTAMPGETGNVVIAGHRTTYTRPFWDLQALEPGDELIFDMLDGGSVTYELERLDVVSPTDVHIIEQTPERRATLFACHPRGSARQRIVAQFVMRQPVTTYEVFDTLGVRGPRR